MTVGLGKSNTRSSKDNDGGQEDIYARAIDFYCSELSKLDMADCTCENQKRRAGHIKIFWNTIYTGIPLAPVMVHIKEGRC